MPGIFCLGYDVEGKDEITTRLFLEKMIPIHSSRDAPCSLFIVGQTLERNVEDFRPLVDDPLFDLEQHTYSHFLFKQLREEVNRKVQIYGTNEPLEKIRFEIAKASELFRTLLNHDVIGITTPCAFYKGLADRPDILQVLHDEGIRFCRSYGRNIKGTSPVSLDVQPYYYDRQGFPDLLECPLTGWQDVLWRMRFGWKANWEEQVFMDLDYIAEHDLYYGLVQHDWSSIQEDIEMERTTKILDYAQSCDVRIMNYRQFASTVQSGEISFKCSPRSE
ncbi:MAG: polysaccharide deacetylase family protein [Candidatus Lokiarchaeota archaeon]|nr:polysaccharide deacetylase family protein [Candidatus Lokiarchaeota archaeon]